MRTNIEIAQAAKCKPIEEVASKIGLSRDEVQHYGKYMAKIPLDVLKRFDDKPNGKLIVTIDLEKPHPSASGKTLILIVMS